jgi:hypothetical protein
MSTQLVSLTGPRSQASLRFSCLNRVKKGEKKGEKPYVCVYVSVYYTNCRQDEDATRGTG